MAITCVIQHDTNHLDDPNVRHSAVQTLLPSLNTHVSGGQYVLQWVPVQSWLLRLHAAQLHKTRGSRLQCKVYTMGGIRSTV